jgi:hypothetical protein
VHKGNVVQYTMKVYKVMEVKHIRKCCEYVELSSHHGSTSPIFLEENWSTADPFRIRW